MSRARAGDEQAFAALIDPHRRELLVHCYRMLGSLDDAEDALQETIVAAWRGLAGFQERASVRAWLYRIATNRCLNARRAARRRPAAPQPPFLPPEPTRLQEVTWLQACPDTLLDGYADDVAGPEARLQATEAVKLAFVEILQVLPPRQAAALVLCDVLGFAPAEAAAMMGSGPTAVKGLLQRARAAARTLRLPEHAAAQSPQAERLAQEFAERYAADDIDSLLELLTDDAWLTMPPAPHAYRGPSAIGAFLAASRRWRNGRRYRLVPTAANRQPAFASYLPELDGSAARPAGLLVLTVDGDRISCVTRFFDAPFGRFGLPSVL